MLLINLLCSNICIFQWCFMYDWFVLFVCTVTAEPHQSQYFCLAQEEVHTWAEAKRLFVWGFYFCLPPSLSLPSEQSVSVATSHPSPLHPDWQMQCQTFWSRTHLPLLLHSPGQPSVNISCARQTAEQVRTRKSGERGGREDKVAKGAFRVDRGRGGTKMIKDSIGWTYSTIHLWQDWGCGEGCEELLSFHMSFRSMYSHTEEWNAWDKRGGNLLSCSLTVEKGSGRHCECPLHQINWC